MKSVITKNILVFMIVTKQVISKLQCLTGDQMDQMKKEEAKGFIYVETKA